LLTCRLPSIASSRSTTRSPNPSSGAQTLTLSSPHAPEGSKRWSQTTRTENVTGAFAREILTLVGDPFTSRPLARQPSPIVVVLNGLIGSRNHVRHGLFRPSFCCDMSIEKVDVAVEGNHSASTVHSAAAGVQIAPPKDGLLPPTHLCLRLY
jgi:hypothetical protein